MRARIIDTLKASAAIVIFFGCVWLLAAKAIERISQ